MGRHLLNGCTLVVMFEGRYTVGLLATVLAGCASAATLVETAIAADEDLGDPRNPARNHEQLQREAASLEDPDATVIDFDGAEENDAPVETIRVNADRSASESMMQSVVLGPS